MRSLLLSFELYSDPPTKTVALLPCLGQGQSQGKFLAGTVVKAIRQAQLKRNDAIILGGVWFDAGRFKELLSVEDKDQIIEYQTDLTAGNPAVILSRVSEGRCSQTRIEMHAWLKEIRWIKDEWHMSRPYTDPERVVNRIAALI